jgi:transketolase
MPIFVFSCVNCKSKVEKIVLAKVKVSTVPAQIVERCKKCNALTRHLRAITAPAYIGVTPPGTSKKATQMSQLRTPKDKDWKERVKKGLNPAGQSLTNLKELNQREWEEQVDTAFPDLKEKQKEVAGRVKTGELTNLIAEATGNR